MRYGSVCSGIEAASVAWKPLGWRAAFLSEIEKFPSAVLAHHHPEVPNRGDMTKYKDWPDDAIDLLVGGTPCQSFSVAGLRQGLADPRGNLMLTYLAILAKYQPRWMVWENVPGVFSSTSHDAPDSSPPDIDLDASDGPKDGEEVVVQDCYDADESHAFACLLAGLQELGYGLAYRTLDAQFVRVDGYGRAVPQRRRRVFVVGYLGDWRRAAAVLLEPEGMQGDSAPRREKGSAVAALTANGVGTCGADDNQAQAGHFVAEVSRALTASHTATGRLDPNEMKFIARTVAVNDTVGAMCAESGPNTHGSRGVSGSQTLLSGYIQPVAFDTTQITSRSNYSQPKAEDPCHPLAAGAHPPAVAFQSSQSGVRLDDVHATLDSNNGSRRHNGVITGWAVRRLTPTECERLQGFPDGYTNIPWRGKEASDGPRYKALGNSMAVNVMRWIGRRIEMVERLSEARAA